MSLLINGMDMPKNKGPLFYACLLALSADGSCEMVFTDKSYPIAEVPIPHGRLIDADAHIQSLRNNQCGERCRKNHDCVNCGIGMYIRIVENEPTIIEAEGL